MIAEAIRSGAVIEEVFATEVGLATIQLLLTPLDVPVWIVAERALERISDLDTPPGAIAVLHTRFAELGTLLGAGKPALVLAGVSDPGNAGTLLRSAEIFGVGAAIFAHSGVEPYAPKVVRGSMGAIFRLELAVVEPDDLLQAAARTGYRIVAAVKNGTPLSAFIWPSRSLIAVGNERRGVSYWLPRYDDGVTIPQAGDGESLNAAVAGSIVLYAFSQRS